MAHLDHILWGAPNLEAAVATFADLSGVEPAVGGSHTGFGTRNRLLTLGENLFLEVIAPDPAQSVTTERVEALAGMPHPGLISFCVAGAEIGAFAEKAKAAGIGTREPRSMGRTRPDGVKLAWQTIHLVDEEMGTALPFLIDWQESPHPSTSTPGGCSLIEFSVLHPNAPRLRAIFDGLEIPVPVKAAARPGFLARLETPKGEVVLTAP